jgi:hypothetical protein
MSETEQTAPVTRPDPYVPPGDGWLWKVRVPQHGVWVRPDGQVSPNWTVFKQEGRDYHISISSAFLNDHSKALLTHVTSEAAFPGGQARWPIQGVPSVPQQQWLNAHNTGQLDTLIAAFSDRLRRCAANITPSRDYDESVARRRKEAFAAAASKRVVNAGYREDLADWLASFPAQTYLTGFRTGQAWCFLDHDRGLVIRLDPVPLRVKQGEQLDAGFVGNVCTPLISGPVTPLTQDHWNTLTDGVVLLSFNGDAYAMRREQFDACQADRDVLSLSQVVELAVSAWVKDAASIAPYEVVAFDKTVMNVTSPDSARCQLLVKDLLDADDLRQFGTTEGVRIAIANHPKDLPDGVYAVEWADGLSVRLPRVLPVKRGKRIYFIRKDQLLEGWSEDLEKASTVSPELLAGKLISYQVFVEDLVVGDSAGPVVYLWSKTAKQALFVALLAAFMPEASVSKLGTIPVDEMTLRVFFDGGLSNREAATSQNAIVIVNNKGNQYSSPVFVDKSLMREFDYPQAKAAYEAVLKEQEKKEDLAKADAAVRITSYPQAWELILGQMESDRPKIDFYKKDSDGSLVVVVASDNLYAVPGAKWFDQLWVKKEDKRLTSKGPLYRYLKFSPIAEKPLSRDWIKGFVEYLETNKPKPPQGIKQYLMSLAAKKY